MQRTIVLIFYFASFTVPIIVKAQGDVLVLKKRTKHILSFAIGSKLDMVTIYDQEFNGVITEMRHDSVFIDGQPFHYKEIAVIKRVRIRSGFLMIGWAMTAAAGGIIVLGAVNGILRNDKPKDWYTNSALITAGAAAVVGYVLRKAFYINYRMGKKFKLEYLGLNVKM